MKSTMTMRLAVLVQYVVIAAVAYPGGQQPRSTMQPTPTSLSSLEEASKSSRSYSDNTLNTQNGLTSAFVEVKTAPFPTPSYSYSASVAAASAKYHGSTDGLSQIDDGHQQTQSAGTYYEGKEDAGNRDDYDDDDDDDDDDCEEPDDCDDQDYEEGETTKSVVLPREVKTEAISSMLADVKVQLQKIESLLALSKADFDGPPAQHQQQQHNMKREANNVFDQGRAYGQQSRHLTQEQRNSLMALVKGINGYQTSIDGIENAGQTETEISRETSQTIHSNPLLSSLTPSQADDLAYLLSLLLSGKMASNNTPSTTSIASQVGQSASQAGWMVPGEGNLRDAGYTVQSNADMKDKYAVSTPIAADTPEGVQLLDKLQDLKEQQQQIMAQLAKYTTSPPQPGGSERVQAKEQDTVHPLSDAQYDELSSMLLVDQASVSSSSAATQIVSSSMLTSATQSAAPSSSSSSSPVPSPRPLQNRAYSAPTKAPLAGRETNDLSALVTDAVSQAIAGPLLSMQDLLDLRELINSHLDQARERH